MTNDNMARNENENTALAEPKTEETRSPERYITPPVDIVESKEGLRITADMPGAKRESIDISVEEDVLTLRGALEYEPGRRTSLREFGPVNFFRQFKLGTHIDQEKIAAEFRNGVLTVRLPLAEKARPRRITVNAN